MDNLYDKLTQAQKDIITEVCEELRITEYEVVVSNYSSMLALKYQKGYYILPISIEEIAKVKTTKVIIEFDDMTEEEATAYAYQALVEYDAKQSDEACWVLYSDNN